MVSFMLNIKVPPKHCSDICGDNAGAALKDFHVQNALYSYLQLSFPLSQTVHKQGKNQNGLHSVLNARIREMKYKVFEVTTNRFFPVGYPD